MAGEGDLFRQLKKAFLERAMDVGLTPASRTGCPDGRESGNSRDRTSTKALLTDEGEIRIGVPRGRAGTSEPMIVAKGQTRFNTLDENIISVAWAGHERRHIRASGRLSSRAPRIPPI
nr:transposase [Bradyrhizobium cytisi]